VKLAKKIGVNTTTVVNWEVKGRVPCSRYLERLRRVIPGLNVAVKASHSNVP